MPKGELLKKSLPVWKALVSIIFKKDKTVFASRI